MLNVRVAVAAVCLLSSLTAIAAKPDPKSQALADRVAADVAGIKEGETVVIVGSFDDQAFLSDLVMAVAKRGGLPVVTIDDPLLARRWLEEGPAARDSAWSAAAMKMVPLPDVMLVVDRRDSSVMKGIAPERLAAFQSGFVGLDQARLKRGTRTVYIGNGLFPAKGTAKDVGLSDGELKKAYEAGLATDYKALAATGDAVKAAMVPGKEVVVKTKAGTDFKFKIGKKPFYVSDGAISAEEMKAGGASVLSWIPAGECYGLAEPGTGDGKLVEPRVPFEGGEIKDLVVELKAGKVVSMTAKPSKTFDRFKAMFDAGAAGKELFSVVDIGLNPDVKVKGKAIRNFVPAGTVTLAWGGDTWAGGTNNAATGGAVFLSDATVTVDGAVVVDAGVLKTGAK